MTAARASACGVTSPRKAGMHLFAAYESGAHGSYGSGGNELRVAGCGATSRGKFIMLAMGPDILSKDFHRSNSYTGTFLNDRCKVANSQIPEEEYSSYEQRLEYYRLQTRTLTTCVEMLVTDNSRLGINFPEHQPGCQISRIDRNTAKAKGGYCFFRINPDSDFRVSYQVNPDCSLRDFLVSQNIRPIDFNSAASVYIAGDASGHSTDLTHVDLVDTRFSIQPSADLIPLSTNFGPNTPRWPSTWSPDVHFGAISINAGNFPKISASFLASNLCSETCRDGLCSSPCDYLIPGAAEVRLYRLEDDQSPKLLDIWYQGGAVPAQWQGLLPGDAHSLGFQPFAPSKRYRITMKFAYPDTYYRLAKDGYRQFLISLINIRPGNPSIYPLTPLDPMVGMAALYRNLPGVKPLPGLQTNMNNLETTWREPLETLASYLDFEGWPPFYEAICDPHLERCRNPYKEPATTVVALDFTIAELSSPEYQLSDLVVRRESNTLGNYELPIDTQPSLECQ